MSNPEICGSTDTKSGDPCKTPAHLCQWHGDESNPDGGRPTKLTYERQEAIAAAIEDGEPVVAACRQNEISHQTHANWMERGRDQDEGVYAEYFGRLARALGHDQSKKTKQMWATAQAEGDVDAMLTVLKQRYPETWQDQDLGEAKGGGNGLSEDERAAIREGLADRRGG